jgi:hypothetical protein
MQLVQQLGVDGGTSVPQVPPSDEGTVGMQVPVVRSQLVPAPHGGQLCVGGGPQPPLAGMHASTCLPSAVTALVQVSPGAQSEAEAQLRAQ